MVVETMEVAEAAGARGQGRLAGCDFWRRAVRSRPCEGSCTRDSAIGRRGARCVPQESRRVRWKAHFHLRAWVGDNENQRLRALHTPAANAEEPLWNSLFTMFKGQF